MQKCVKTSIKHILLSVYKNSPNSFKKYETAEILYLMYGTCQYSISRNFVFHVVKYKSVVKHIHSIHICSEDYQPFYIYYLSKHRGN